MPELPEVATVVDALADPLTGAEVVAVVTDDGPRWTAPRSLVGATFDVPARRGKWILVPTVDGRELVVHLGMTGALLVDTFSPTLTRPTRVRWSLRTAAGKAAGLRLDDVRGFGRTAVVAAGDHSSLRGLASLGPEPLAADFDVAAAAAALSASAATVKATLLSGKVVAGVGNIYADEALHAARVHPAERHLCEPRAVTVIEAVRDALQAGMVHGGTTLRDYRRPDGTSGSHQDHLAAYGRYGQPCPRCATPLDRVTVAGRTSTFCPRCQPGP